MPDDLSFLDKYVKQVDVSDLLERMRGSTFKQESGGNYQVRRNQRTGAVGGFQVMPANIPNWTKTYVGRSYTPDEFERDPKAQEAVFSGEMGKYLRKARRMAPDDDTAIRMAAAAWYGGEGAMKRYDDPKRFRPNEPSFREYTSSVLNKSRTTSPNLSFLDKYVDAKEPTFLDKYLPPQTVPEPAETIALQREAAANPKVKSRTGVLLNKGDVPAPAEWEGFSQHETPDGRPMMVHGESAAKNLKLKTPDDIDTFVKKNPAAIERMVGIVDPVDNTGGNQPVVTAQVGGKEAASAVVTSDEKAQHQADVYREQFPQAEIGMATADDIAAQRNAEAVSSQIDELVAISNAAKAGQRYGQPQQVQGRAKQAKAASGRSVGVGASAPVLGKPEFTVDTTGGAGVDFSDPNIQAALNANYDPADQENISDTKEVKGGLRATPRKQVGKETDSLDRVVSTFYPTSAKDDRDATIQALVDAGERWGLTKDQATRYVDSLGKPLQKGGWKPNTGIQVTYEDIANATGRRTEIEADLRVEQVQNRVERPDLSLKKPSNLNEFDSEKAIEERIKSPAYSAQQRFSDFISNPLNIFTPLGMVNLPDTVTKAVSEVDPVWAEEEKDRLLKQYGSFAKAWDAEKYYQDMTWGETFVRAARQTAGSFAKNLVSGTGKSVAFLGQLAEDLTPANLLLNDEAKVGLRNTVNFADFLVRLLQTDSKTAWKETDWAKSDDISEQQIFRAMQEFDKAIGDDPVLKHRFLGALSDAGGSAAAFIALGALMPSMQLGKFAMGRAAINKGLSKTAQKLAVKAGGLPLETAVAGAAQTMGAGYEEAKKNGLTEGQAKAFGVIEGLLGTTEMVGAGAGLSQFLKNPTLRRQFANALLETGKTIKREAKQEFAQEVFQTTSGKAVMAYLKDNDPSTLTKLTNALNRLPKQLSDTIANEGLIAIITGGAVGGATTAAQTASNISPQPKAETREDVPSETQNVIEKPQNINIKAERVDDVNIPQPKAAALRKEMVAQGISIPKSVDDGTVEIARVLPNSFEINGMPHRLFSITPWGGNYRVGYRSADEDGTKFADSYIPLELADVAGKTQEEINTFIADRIDRNTTRKYDGGQSLRPSMTGMREMPPNLEEVFAPFRKVDEYDAEMERRREAQAQRKRDKAVEAAKPETPAVEPQEKGFEVVEEKPKLNLKFEEFKPPLSADQMQKALELAEQDTAIGKQIAKAMNSGDMGKVAELVDAQSATSAPAKPLPRVEGARELPPVETTGEVGNNARVVRSRPRKTTTQDWREAVDKETDLITKHSRLRAVADVSLSNKELSDVLDHIEGEKYGEASNIAWDIAHNPRASDAIKKRAQAMYDAIYRPVTKEEWTEIDRERTLRLIDDIEKEIASAPRNKNGTVKASHRQSVQSKERHIAKLRADLAKPAPQEPQAKPKTPPLQMAMAKRSEPFYSRVESVIKDKMPPRATPAQITALLAKNSVKELDPEMQAVKVYLSEQGGTVSKADVLAFVEGNRSAVSEVVKGDVHWQGIDLMADGERVASLIENDDGTWSFESDLSEGEESFASREEAKQEAEVATIHGIHSPNGVHFAQWQLPGESENYREEFLTAPDGGGWLGENSKGEGKVFNDKVMAVAFAGKNGEVTPWASETGWKDGHGDYDDVTNPIARIRYNDRTTTDGDKMLFVEEIQQPSKDNVAKMPKVYQKFGEQMAIRKMLYRAVEGDYDYFGFTTGQQQADRYDLSKHVKQIRTKAWSGGNRKVEIVPIKGADIEIEITPDGKVVEGYKEFIGKNLDEVVGKDLAPQILEAPTDGYKVFSGLDLKVGGEGLIQRYDRKHVDYINKLMKPYGVSVEAKKISARGDATDLRIRIYPTSTGYSAGISGKGVLASVTTSSGKVQHFDTKAEAENAAQKLLESYQGHTVHAVRISPEFKAAVQTAMRDYGGAFPLFHKLEVTNEMRDVAQRYTDDLFEVAKFSRQGAQISAVNLETYGIMRQLINTALGEDSDFGGTILDKGQIEKVRQVMAEVDTSTWSGRAKRNLTRFASEFDKAAQHYKKEPLVEFILIPDAITEEAIHGAFYQTVAENTIENWQSPEFVKDVLASPLYKATTVGENYADRTDAVKAHEFITKLLAGKWTDLGIDPDAHKTEILQTLRDWKDDYEKVHGKFDETEFRNASEMAEYFFAAVESQSKGADKQESRSDENTVKREPDGEAAGRAGVESDKTSDVSPKQEQRVAAFSRHLDNPIYYTPQSHEVTDIRASQLISDKGVDRAVRDALTGLPSAEGMKVVYNEFARQNAIYNHYRSEGKIAEANAAAAELADLAARITQRQINTGREVEVAKTFDVLSEGIALLTAQRMLTLRYGEGAELSQQQIDSTSDIAKELQKVVTELDEVRAKLAESESKERRLSDEKKPSKKKRPETTQERLLKEYKDNKPKILKSLSEMFPKSPLFNGETQATLQMAIRDASYFETELDPEKIAVLTQFATGQILEGMNYDSLIKTLQDLGLTEADAQQIQADAVDVIRPAREPRSPEAKERVKIRQEHYRKAKAFEGKGEPRLSGIAQDAQEDAKYKDNEPLIKVIDYMTNPETARAGRSLNGLINNIRKDNPEMSMQSAEELAGQAYAAVKDLRAKRKAAKDKQANISADYRKQLNELTVKKRHASRRMNEHLKQIGQRNDYAMKRINNLFRGLFVNNYGTQLFNAVQSTVVANPSEMALDGIATFLKSGLHLDVGENTDIQAKDLLLPMAYVFGNNKQIAEQSLAKFPEQYFRIHAGILGDIEIDKVPQGESAHWLTKPLHKVLDKADTGLTKLSHITGAKMQEMHFRNAMVAARFDQIIRQRSKGADNLESAMTNGNFEKYVTEKDAIKAADDALEVTFASEINDPIGKKMKAAYDQLDNFVPIFLNPIVYARFTYTVTKAMVANPLLFGALDAQVAGGRGYNNRSIAKGVLAWGGVATAYALMAALGGDDDRWDTLYIFGEDEPPISVKRFFPLSSYFYVAHLIKTAKEGGTPPTMEDLVEGFASLETEYFQYGAPVELATSLGRFARGTGTKEEVGASSARMLGNFFGGILSFFRPVKVAVSAIDDEEKALRDNSDTAKDKFLSEMARTLPGVIRLSDTKKKVDPVTEQPILQSWPLGRLVGINVVHPSFLSNKDSAATQWAGRLFSYTGASDTFTAQERNAFFIKRRLREAVRKGILTADEGNERAKKYLAETLSPQSMGRLKDELKMSELQTKIKYGFGINPKNPRASEREIANLRIVWNKATDQEKEDIRVVLQKKDNLTPEFRTEFGIGASKPKPKAPSKGGFRSFRNQ